MIDLYSDTVTQPTPGMRQAMAQAVVGDEQRGEDPTTNPLQTQVAALLGKAVFIERCASCHGETGEDPKYSRLVGGQGSLATDKPIKTIGSFWQYASTLWSYIRRV